MTAVLRAETSADFLAMVPALAGFEASESIVCVMFQGNRTCGALRLDLPADRLPARYRSVATALVGLLSNAGRVDRVAPVVYTNSTFAEERGTPWRDLMRVLRPRLEDAGYRISEALCVAADGWASYLDPGRPAEARPLAEIAASPLAERPEVKWGPPDIRELGELPRAGREGVREMRRALAAIARLRSRAELAAAVGKLDGDGGLDPVSWVERCLDLAERAPAPAAAWLLELVQSPPIRDAAMVQIAFGEEAGEDILDSNEYYAAIQRRSGQTMDELMLEELEEGRTWPGFDVGAAIMGDLEERPDLDRLGAGIRLLRHVIAHSPEALQPAPLCMLAWLSWCRGLSSVAARHVEAALAIDPDYGMARVLWSLFASGKLPRWVFAGMPDVRAPR